MSRDELIAAMQATAANKPRAVKTKAWGDVYVRDITVAEVDEQAEIDSAQEKDREQIIAKGETPPKRDKYRIARSAARIICDADGKRVFDPDDATDVALLAAQPWQMLSAILNDKKDDEAGN